MSRKCVSGLLESSLVLLLCLSVLLSITCPFAACNPVEISMKFDSDPEQMKPEGLKMLKSLMVDLHKTFYGYVKRMKKGDSVRNGDDDENEDPETAENEDDAAMSDVAKDFTHSLNIVQKLIMKHQIPKSDSNY